MDAIRIGKPTSSSIHKLMKRAKNGVDFGAPAFTYIKEKKRELRLGIEINVESSSHSTSWGRALEGYVYDTHIEPEYVLESTSTDIHSSGLWCGTKDLLKTNCVGDIKCPATRNSFCDLVEIIEAESIEQFKNDCPEYYWQLVSNSILTNVEYAELIVFMPFAKEIPAIIEYFDVMDDFEMQKDIQWVIHSELKRIPHLPDDSKYNNLYRFKFLVPQEDKIELEETIIKATNLINE